MSVALTVVAVLVALGLAGWLHLRYWVRKLTVPLHYASTERLALADGAAIELRHLAHEPSDEVREPPLPPVLIVHGIGANHRNLDLTNDRSLARVLAAAGRDVWLLRLRSALPTPARLMRFDAMVKHDVPTAVRAVLAHTGQPALDYVGFSMGGMLLYAGLGRTVPLAEVRRAVLVGSPGRIVLPLSAMRALRFLPRALTPSLPVRVLSRLTAFAADWLPTTPLHHVVYNPRNMPPGLAGAALVNMIEDLPGALLADFAAWGFADGELRLDGARLLDGLHGVETPVAFYAGAADGLAPPDSVRAAHDAWGAKVPGFTDKSFAVLGVAHGSSADYGHGDLAAGEAVARELFEPVLAFLDRG